MDKDDKRELLAAITALGEKLSGDIKGLQTDVRSMSDRIARLEGRFEEQSRTVTALIPQRLAQVGDRKQ